jgi:hypothetical protein
MAVTTDEGSVDELNAYAVLELVPVGRLGSAEKVKL